MSYVQKVVHWFQPVPQAERPALSRSLVHSNLQRIRLASWCLLPLLGVLVVFELTYDWVFTFEYYVQILPYVLLLQALCAGLCVFAVVWLSRLPHPDGISWIHKTGEMALLLGFVLLTTAWIGLLQPLRHDISAYLAMIYFLSASLRLPLRKSVWIFSLPWLLLLSIQLLQPINAEVLVSLIGGSFMTLFAMVIAQLLQVAHVQELMDQRRIERQAQELREINEKLNDSNTMLESTNGQLLQLSREDGLTSLPNRRHFDEFFEISWHTAVRNKLPVSLMMVDIDHFKKLNDCYGHKRGDDCLVQVAWALDHSIQRSLDLVARFGGEEFVVLLNGTDEKGARIVATRMLDAIQTLRIQNRDSDNGYLTVSIGISHRIPGQKDTRETLLEEADKALYQAKNAGRNRVVEWGGGPPGQTEPNPSHNQHFAS